MRTTMLSGRNAKFAAIVATAALTAAIFLLPARAATEATARPAAQTDL